MSATSTSNERQTRRHVNQRKLHTWCVGPSSSFVEHHESLDHFLQPFSFYQKAECRVQESSGKYSERGVRQWRNRDQWIRFFFLAQKNYEGSTHSMGQLQVDTKRSCQEQGASCKRAEGRPSTKSGHGQQSTSARKDTSSNDSLAWTSRVNAPRTVMLRTMSFVMTPPAVSTPMSKRAQVRSGRPSKPCERFTRWEGHQANPGSARQRSRATRGELHRERKETERGEPHQSRRAVSETPKATEENARAGKMTRPTKACTEPEQANQREHNGQEVDKPAMGAG